MKCDTHPDVETSLRCGKCGRPICPRCMVETPVGARCRQCARLYRLPTFRVSRRHYLLAGAVGFGLALVSGLIWGIIARVLPFFYTNLLIAAGIGWVQGELISITVNRKRGTGLAIVAALAVVLSYLVAVISPWGFGLSLFDLLALSLGILLAVGRLR